MKYINVIETNLNNKEDHILYYLKGTDYYHDFLDAMECLEKEGVIDSEKLKKALLEKLQLKPNRKFNSNKYLQGVSEILFWIYCARNGFKIHPEHKLNKDNGTDVDARIENEGVFFNIEVKCPNQEDFFEDEIKGSLAYRVPGVSKEEADSMMKDIDDMLKQAIDKHPEMGVRSSMIKKTNDNKIITFMDSAQSKFSYSDNEMNVLVIALTSEQMQLYYNYLCNPYSGILSGNLSQFGRTESEFDKIDLVLLTNIVSGHLAETNINAWELNDYCTVGFINQFSHGIKKFSKPLSKFVEIFPDEAKRFQEERNVILKSRKNMPVDEMFFYEYLSKYHHDIYNPNEKRKYWFEDGKVASDLIGDKNL